MTIDQFWKIVDGVHRESEGDMDTKCELLEAELKKLPVVEVKSFCEHFDDCEDKAYSSPLWAAAYIIGGGCSDDSFSDFRATLISTGRSNFERVVASPAVLGEMDVDEDNAFYEGYQYVPTQLYKGMTGNLPMRTKPHPESPSGTSWDEDKVAELFPDLAKKHGFNS